MVTIVEILLASGIFLFVIYTEVKLLYSKPKIAK